MNTKARIDALEKKNEELEEEIKKLKKNRKDMFIHLNNEVQQKEQELKDYEEGAQQIQMLMNSILIGLALDYGGDIKIRRDHLELLDEYMIATTFNNDGYFVRIKKKDTCTKDCDNCDWDVCPYREEEE